MPIASQRFYSINCDSDTFHGSNQSVKSRLSDMFPFMRYSPYGYMPPVCVICCILMWCKDHDLNLIEFVKKHGDEASCIASFEQLSEEADI